MNVRLKTRLLRSMLTLTLLLTLASILISAALAAVVCVAPGRVSPTTSHAGTNKPHYPGMPGAALAGSVSVPFGSAPPTAEALPIFRASSSVAFVPNCGPTVTGLP